MKHKSGRKAVPSAKIGKLHSEKLNDMITPTPPAAEFPNFIFLSKQEPQK
jgi:hypothetical protein